jgi:allophanate hydrolase
MDDALELMPLTIAVLSRSYESGALSPTEAAEAVLVRIDRARGKIDNVWLHVEPRERLLSAARVLEARKKAGEQLPLYGIPFAVKDNIDVGGVPTTAACAAFTHVPALDATVVGRLLAAGALFVGKTNLDQLATGLVGVRSPYGVATNPFDATMIPGGSSSGSAVAVSAGQVAFALGTDTAGSGRVPAAFNNIVGLKPTRGFLSTSGVVPACRSLDCVSIFALTVSDACLVANVAKGFDPSDGFSRPEADVASFRPAPHEGAFRFGVPREEDLFFDGDKHARDGYARAVEGLTRIGGVKVEIDLRPLREVGDLLYGGPWVVERLVAGQPLLERAPESLVPVLREILTGAESVRALDVFRGQYRLQELAHAAATSLAGVDLLVVPSAPTIYPVAEVMASPIASNTKLGTYTNFVNLLDMCALAVPAGFRADGLPHGITLIATRGRDGVLAGVGRRYVQSLRLPLGATGLRLADGSDEDVTHTSELFSMGANGPAPDGEDVESVLVTVVGAHLDGLPLNHQLREAGATLARSCRTAPTYRLYALPGTAPPKPGMLRVAEGGAAIDVEVWRMPLESYGAFVAKVPRPLCIGTIALDDGSAVQGFLCEPAAVDGAEDISAHGGWRKYLGRLK